MPSRRGEGPATQAEAEKLAEAPALPQAPDAKAQPEVVYWKD